jgi:hypothetical protein
VGFVVHSSFLLSNINGLLFLACRDRLAGSLALGLALAIVRHGTSSQYERKHAAKKGTRAHMIRIECHMHAVESKKPFLS